MKKENNPEGGVMTAAEVIFNIEQIKQILPHRFPFLLIDRVLEHIENGDPKTRVGQKATAIKNVTSNESHFNGHFPQEAIMPGVLLIEAMAQAGGIACYKKGQEPKNLVIANIKDAKFRRPVIPGDQVILKGIVLKDRGKMVTISCQAFVLDKLVAECEVLAVITNLGVGS